MWIIFHRFRTSRHRVYKIIIGVDQQQTIFHVFCDLNRLHFFSMLCVSLALFSIFLHWNNDSNKIKGANEIVEMEHNFFSWDFLCNKQKIDFCLCRSPSCCCTLGFSFRCLFFREQDRPVNSMQLHSFPHRLFTVCQQNNNDNHIGRIVKRANEKYKYRKTKFGNMYFKSNKRREEEKCLYVLVDILFVPFKQQHRHAESEDEQKVLLCDAIRLDFLNDSMRTVWSWTCHHLKWNYVKNHVRTQTKH